MEIQATGCSDCPMCNEFDSENYYCRIVTDPDLIIKEDENFNPITPSWCPLKTEPVIITLKEN